MPLHRILVLHGAVGFGIAALFVLALIAVDPGGIGHLLVGPAGGALPIAMLWFFSGIVFGSAQFAAAVAFACRDGEEGRPGGLRLRPMPALVPVPVRQGLRRR
ncbi:hypothetical protein [Roseicella frigidaeris]|uniref:Uncharacterized protein n=1 Tax=Roseicella frigidaeris TaxID=2230885 RepID=A0A327M1V0_9PROT|nr:hypothetical protein [Roseicella frigidaeris]RAI56142.1 hypothetical protein DOO78_22595 [Roseicella frigidaeris]